MNSQVQHLIDKFSLQPHPEGGYYKETYRASGMLECPWDDTRKLHYSTGIYFLLTREGFSAFHRIRSDEMWHFYAGDPLEVWSIDDSGNAQRFVLSEDNYQEVVPAGRWFASRTLGEYSLSGCTVAPGFDFMDFELADRDQLIKLFPEHRNLIEQFSRAEI